MALLKCLTPTLAMIAMQSLVTASPSYCSSGVYTQVTTLSDNLSAQSYCTANHPVAAGTDTISSIVTTIQTKTVTQSTAPASTVTVSVVSIVSHATYTITAQDGTPIATTSEFFTEFGKSYVKISYLGDRLHVGSNYLYGCRHINRNRYSHYTSGQDEARCF